MNLLTYIKDIGSNSLPASVLNRNHTDERVIAVSLLLNKPIINLLIMKHIQLTLIKRYLDLLIR
jgi:hypothetical protein